MKCRRSKRNAIQVIAMSMMFSFPLAGCGRKPKTPKHAAAQEAAAPAPTPDNTPIPVLRTPAGLILKPDEPGPATPTPPTTPAATPSPRPTV